MLATIADHYRYLFLVFLILHVFSLQKLITYGFRSFQHLKIYVLTSLQWATILQHRERLTSGVIICYRVASNSGSSGFSNNCVTYNNAGWSAALNAIRSSPEYGGAQASGHISSNVEMAACGGSGGYPWNIGSMGNTCKSKTLNTKQQDSGR